MRALTLLLLLAVLAGGLWLGGHPERLPDPVREAFVDDRAALSVEVIKRISEDFYEPVDRNRLENASIEGVVEALGDRFSHYFDPKTYGRFREALTRQYSGVGLTVNEVKRGLRVASVFERTPASRAGIRRGDVILAVNGRSIAGVSSDVATAKIKGPPSTSVTLTVLRPASGRKRELRLRRSRVKVPAAVGEMKRLGRTRIAYARLATFSDGSHGELRKEIERLYRRGAEGLVLDLRANGGGLLQEAVLTTSLFIPRGVVVSTQGRSRPRRVYHAVGDSLPRKPLVVLVDGDSASASEIVAAALNERGFATLVGTKTFGKGTFQEVISLPNGGALDLTVGEYVTPEGHHLNRKGIRPAIRAADRRRTSADEALDRALRVLQRALAKKR